MANIDFCINVGGNTGLPRCDIKMGVPIGVIFAPRDGGITPDDAEELYEFIIEKTRANSPLERYYPIIGIEQITDNTEEPVTGTLASTGYTEKLRDGSAIYLFEYPASLCKQKVLAQFDGWSEGIFIIDSNKRIWGRGQKDGSLLPYIPLSIYIYGGGFGDGQNPITQKLNINFGNQKDFVSTSMFFGLEEDDDLKNLTGLQTVELVPTGTANQFRLQTNCDKTNLYDQYKTQLSEVSVWKLTVASTGVDVDISAVAAVDSLKAFTLTFDVPTEKYYVSLADVTTLETAGIVGYESKELLIKP